MHRHVPRHPSHPSQSAQPALGLWRTWNVQERSCSPSCRSWSTGVCTLMRFSLVSAATGKERTTTCSPTWAESRGRDGSQSQSTRATEARAGGEVEGDLRAFPGLHPSGGGTERQGKSQSPQSQGGGGRRRVQWLTQGVSGHPCEDDPVGGEEDGSLGWEQCGAPHTAPCTLLTPVREQVDTQTVQHTFLARQQAWPQQFGLFGHRSGTSGQSLGPGARSPAWTPLTFWMGGSRLLSRCTASRVSICIWTMSAGQQLSPRAPTPTTQGDTSIPTPPIPGTMTCSPLRWSLVTPLSVQTLSTKRLMKRTTAPATSQVSASSKPLSVS